MPTDWYAGEGWQELDDRRARAITSASEVRCQARNVRSLAKVNLASGFVSIGPWPAGSPGGGGPTGGCDGLSAKCGHPLAAVFGRAVRRAGSRSQWHDAHLDDLRLDRLGRGWLIVVAWRRDGCPSGDRAGTRGRCRPRRETRRSTELGQCGPAARPYDLRLGRKSRLRRRAQGSRGPGRPRGTRRRRLIEILGV